MKYAVKKQFAELKVMQNTKFSDENNRDSVLPQNKHVKLSLPMT